MQNHTPHSLNCHPLSGLPLFDWRPAPVLNATPIAARKLAQRYGMTIPHAIVVARLAGVGIETEARQ